MSHGNNLTLIILVQNMVKTSGFQWFLFSTVGQEACQVGTWATACHSALKASVKRSTTGWEQNGPWGATMVILLCIRDPTASVSLPPLMRTQKGSTAAQGYVQGQKLFGWLSCISCLNTRSPSTPGTGDWDRWKQFLCQIWDPWAMFWTMLI